MFVLTVQIVVHTQLHMPARTVTNRNMSFYIIINQKKGVM